MELSMTKKLFSFLGMALFVSVLTTSKLFCERQELDGKNYRALRSPLISITNLSNQIVTFAGTGYCVDIPAAPEWNFLYNYFCPLNGYTTTATIEFSAVVPDPIKKGIHQFATIKTLNGTYTLIYDAHTNTLALYDSRQAFVSSIVVFEGITEELEHYKAAYLDINKGCVYRLKKTYNLIVNSDGTVTLASVSSGIALIEFEKDTRIHFNERYQASV